MGKVSDYIDSLEGKDDLTLTEVVSEILKLHNEEVSVSTAKIGQLETTLAEKDSAFAEKEAELSAAKSANWDLSQRIPANDGTPKTPEVDEETGLPDASTISFDDLIK